MRLGYDLEIVHHEYEDERNPEYWYFQYYGDSAEDMKISETYESREAAMKAYRDGSIKWEKEQTKCDHEWFADSDTGMNVCTKCPATQDPHSEPEK